MIHSPRARLRSNQIQKTFVQKMIQLIYRRYDTRYKQPNTSLDLKNMAAQKENTMCENSLNEIQEVTLMFQNDAKEANEAADKALRNAKDAERKEKEMIKLEKEALTSFLVAFENDQKNGSKETKTEFILKEANLAIAIRDTKEAGEEAIRKRAEADQEMAFAQSLWVPPTLSAWEKEFPTTTGAAKEIIPEEKEIITFIVGEGKNEKVFHLKKDFLRTCPSSRLRRTVFGRNTVKYPKQSSIFFEKMIK